MSGLVEAVSALLPLAGGVGFLSKAFVVIREGEGGIHLRAGCYKRTLGPGLYFLLPGYDTILKKNVRLHNQDIPAQSVVLKDGTAYNVQATILYSIRDLKHALLEITDVDYMVTHAAQAIVREVVSGVTRTEVLDSADMNRRLQELAAPQFNSWGVKLERFMMSDVEPTPGTAALLLKEAETELHIQMNQKLLEGLEGQRGLIREVHSYGSPVVTALLMRGVAAPNMSFQVRTTDSGARAPDHPSET